MYDRKKCLKNVFSHFLPDHCSKQRACQNDIKANFVLPLSSLKLLVELANESKARKIFEFGSGKSTKAFLDAGFKVVSMEHSNFWPQETNMHLDKTNKINHVLVKHSLQTVFDGLAPFLAWRESSEMLDHLMTSDLVLVDSPPSPPSREYILLLALRNLINKIVVLDDTNIPTVTRFAERIARHNPEVLYYRSDMDHGLAFFCRVGNERICSGRGVVETAKAWRRYFKALVAKGY
jgi:hypothetical protein